MLSLKRALMLCGMVVAAAGFSAAPARADWASQNGGLQDLSTGIVWSQSQRATTGSWWTWARAQQNAASFVTYDRDASGAVVATYSDWRVPTVAQLQTAVSDGTLSQLIPRNSAGGPLYYGTVYVWSSESRGNKAWTVSVVINSAGQVTGGGQAVLFSKDSGFDVFFVRP